MHLKLNVELFHQKKNLRSGFEDRESDTLQTFKQVFFAFRLQQITPPNHTTNIVYISGMNLDGEENE